MYLKKGIAIAVLFLFMFGACKENKDKVTLPETQKTVITAENILGNPKYLAISYGGYRQDSREVQPTVDGLKEDMRLLAAMGIVIVRTYNVQLPQASNLLKAIRALKEEDPKFEMYVMLGAWIDCKDAWTDHPDHDQESGQNKEEIARAVALANQYPDIVKILAVGNEAMVKWATGYYVQPGVILKWVNHLQDLKKAGQLPKELWITTSDNFAAWGGGDSEYHVKDLEDLVRAVDYISMHTYPMHDTHYNPDFWGTLEEEVALSKTAGIHAAMVRARDYAQAQYQSVVAYMKGLGIEKPVHIGETGWASRSNGFYGPEGTRATDEYKEALYYQMMREWTAREHMACFYFEAFDEPWKDAQNPDGSENHFGLFTVDGKAKYALWKLVDEGVFTGLGRNGKPVEKTYNGNETALLDSVMVPNELIK
ncbi:MAG: glycosyl hydrolase family 17 protein [Flavobacteriaceae bacterium]